MRSIPSPAVAPSDDGVRIFHPMEEARLSLEARGLLLRLTSEGTLSARQREEAVNLALWLDHSDVDADEMTQIVRFLRRPQRRAGFVSPPAVGADASPEFLARWN